LQAFLVCGEHDAGTDKLISTITREMSWASLRCRIKHCAKS
jgi:hypothetical protein